MRAKNVREYWLRNVVPLEVNLTQDSDRVFITRKKKRVYVTTSRENLDGRWGFEAKPKSYEILALLCWDKDFRMHDFIVPQAVFQAPWVEFKKAHKDQAMVFWVTRTGTHYYLELPNADRIDITAYRGQYRPMN